MKILIVEGEADMLGTLTRFLPNESIPMMPQLLWEAEEVSVYEYDCILLDN
jgi:hypothetical protein